MDKIRPVLNQINIVSRDPGASIVFYRRLGVDIPEDGVWRTASGVHHVNAVRGQAPEGACLEIDSVTLSRIWNTGWKNTADVGGRVVIGFHVATREDVDAIYGDMTAAGHRGLQPPFDAFWGARYAVIEDPDGLAVGLMSPADDSKRSAPPVV